VTDSQQPTRPLRVALVQQPADLDPGVNRARLAELTPPDADLVVFPEAFARDFGPAGSDVSAHAEAVDGPFGSELARVAGARGTTIVAGMFETGEDAARPYNTLLVRGAAIGEYRKIHLYDSFGYRESDRLSAGPTKPVVVEVGGFTVGLMTCYDLRFPELARELVRRGAQLLVVPSAWVAGPAKVQHWRTLVAARAIENTAFVAAVGQPGPRYTGHSLVVGPAGDLVAELGDGDRVLTASIESDDLVKARAENPSLLNRRF
jgi:deaminated glutathione amidase